MTTMIYCKQRVYAATLLCSSCKQCLYFFVSECYGVYEKNVLTAEVFTMKLSVRFVVFCPPQTKTNPTFSCKSGSVLTFVKLLTTKYLLF